MTSYGTLSYVKLYQARNPLSQHNYWGKLVSPWCEQLWCLLWPVAWWHPNQANRPHPHTMDNDGCTWFGSNPSGTWVISAWRKPPRKVLYKRTFGMPDQGQMLDAWESQTTESALRWQMRYLVPRHNLELILEVILEHVLRIKTMTWIFNPGSHSDSLSLPKN